MSRLYALLGGRKMANGYLAVALFTLFALLRDTGFVEYAGAVLVALGITNASVALEDRARLRSAPKEDTQ